MRVAFLQFERWSTALATALACALLVAAAALGVWQIVTRFVLERPAEWTEVLIRFGLIWMVFLGIPLALRTGAMVSVDLPLFRGNRQDREVAAARADARALHEMHVDHQREMHAMLTEAWNVARRTIELERMYESDLVPLAEQSVQAALIGYRSNRAMVNEVVAVRRATLETRLKHLRLVADRAQAQYDIDYLVGEAP
jgi:hypothetical protein